ncbi:MAG: hypothetical protein JO350_02635 [Candidatus Eremiobacteraeota bacterium]|nr:hypothetical protein [Candidatus Eremiobacteraeota bacterium]
MVVLLKIHRFVRDRRAALFVTAACCLAACSPSAGSSAVPAGVPAADVASALKGYAKLYAFAGSPSGSQPTGLTVAGKALYGTTLMGGKHNFGTVFARYRSGKVRILWSFRGGIDGAQPQGTLVLVGNAFYGTTEYGGVFGNGTVFAITPGGTERVIYAFKGGADGAAPVLLGMVASKSALIGTTSAGGDVKCSVENSVGCGTIFSVTTSGKERVLYRFKGKSDGALPSGSLVLSGKVLYGTTNFGGVANNGTVYAFTGKGGERVIYAFKGYPDGAVPFGGITQLGGYLYGTTGFGGASNYSGTVYRIDPSGREHVLYNFRGAPDGAVPYGTLIVDKGLLYGTTAYGGNSTRPCVGGGVVGCGTIYAVGTLGKERILYRFGGNLDGANPWTGLVASDGAFFGTTVLGGRSKAGTIFAIAP